MPTVAKGATAATGGRAFRGPSYSNKGYLFGPWLGTSLVSINNYPRSVGLPMIGNPVNYFQSLTGSRLARGNPPLPATTPAPTAANLVANFRRTIGI